MSRSCRAQQTNKESQFCPFLSSCVTLNNFHFLDHKIRIEVPALSHGLNEPVCVHLTRGVCAEMCVSLPQPCTHTRHASGTACPLDTHPSLLPVQCLASATAQLSCHLQKAPLGPPTPAKGLSFLLSRALTHSTRSFPLCLFFLSSPQRVP